MKKMIFLFLFLCATLGITKAQKAYHIKPISTIEIKFFHKTFESKNFNITENSNFITASNQDNLLKPLLNKEDNLHYSILFGSQIKSTIMFNLNLDEVVGNDKKEKVGNSIYYFVGAAIIATTAYFIWSGKESDVETKNTFGKPIIPKN